MPKIETSFKLLNLLFYIWNIEIEWWSDGCQAVSQFLYVNTHKSVEDQEQTL